MPLRARSWLCSCRHRRQSFRACGSLGSRCPGCSFAWTWGRHQWSSDSSSTRSWAAKKSKTIQMWHLQSIIGEKMNKDTGAISLFFHNGQWHTLKKEGSLLELMVLLIIKIFFTIRKKKCFKNCSRKGSLGNQKWFFYYGITAKNAFGTYSHFFKSLIWKYFIYVPIIKTRHPR